MWSESTFAFAVPDVAIGFGREIGKE